MPVGLLAPLTDIMAQLSAIQVVNRDQQTVGLYTRVWNKQIDREQDATNSLGYDFPKPACFVEIISPVQYQTLLGGYANADMGIKLHLCHEYLNQDGTLEQDLEIYGLRDQIVAALTLFKPSGCGAMTLVNDNFDYDHRNIYHYMIDFVCNKTDNVGAIENSQQDSVPPLALVIDAETKSEGGGGLQTFIMPKQ